jgi:hypothetical protein
MDLFEGAKVVILMLQPNQLHFFGFLEPFGQAVIAFGKGGKVILGTLALVVEFLKLVDVPKFDQMLNDVGVI